MINKNLDFYKENNLAPTVRASEGKKDLFEKRKKLYRQLGIPQLCFRDAEVIEFGPSTGENSLVLLEWGRINCVDLVEPNRLAHKMIEDLYNYEQIDKQRYHLYPCLMEEYKTKKKYDIIIAEQFLQDLDNWKDYLGYMEGLTKEGSIIVTTCADVIGLYVEKMKRLIAQIIVAEVEDYDEKVKILLEVFEPTLMGLKGMNRRSIDYVSDVFLSKFYISCKHIMSMVDVIDNYKNRFDVLGASQNMFTDFSWYKDWEYDYLAVYKEQYARKRHMFLVAGDTDETEKSKEENTRLAAAIENVTNMAADYEENKTLDIECFINAIAEIELYTQNKVIKAFDEQLIDILKIVIKKDTLILDNYKLWSSTFGKSSQYIALQRKGE